MEAEAKADLSETGAGVADRSPAPRAGYLLLWGAAGFLIAFGIALMSSAGWFVLIGAGIVLVSAIALTKGQGIAGVLLGAGSSGLFLACLDGDRAALDPLPALGAGVAVLTGIGAEALARRRHAALPGRDRSP